jgi:DNA-3-methyladenine glycosylase
VIQGMSKLVTRLARDFYVRPTLKVAQDLIGKYLVFETGGRLLSSRLVEVEAYIGESDPACHAAVGKTERNKVMYGVGGFSYIYFIYGMYNCLNVVTESEGYSNTGSNKLTNGPGKICKAFGLTREHNGIDLVSGALYLEDRGYKPSKIERSSRIGIKKGADKKWRFFEPSSEYVSIVPKRNTFV